MSQAAVDAGIKDAYGLKSQVTAVKNTRNIGKVCGPKTPAKLVPVLTCRGATVYAAGRAGGLCCAGHRSAW